MVMGDIVEEEPTRPSQQRPVDGRDSATEERPLPVAEVRNSGVGVVEVGQHDNPVVGKLRSNDQGGEY
jgi:hypothetical protein